jgi:acyl carrier protein
MRGSDAIEQRIRQALAEHLKRDPASIASSHRLRDDLGLDSMATIELLYRIEDAFDLQIPDADLPKLATVGNVIAYVEARLAPATPSPPTKTPSTAKAPTRPPSKPSRSRKR